MKKLICVAITAAMAFGMACPALGADSKVTVKNNVSSKGVTYTYDSDYSGETVTSIKTLMTKLSEVAKNKTRTQTLTITSEKPEASPTSFSLRISIPDSVKRPTEDNYAALDYYLIKVNADNGTLIYSYQNETDSDNEAGYKDIPLGVLNTSKANDSETYDITLAVNEDITDANVISAAKNLDWSIVSEGYEAPEETEAPAVETTTPQPAAETAASASPAATRIPSATSSPSASGTVNLAKGEYVAGTDIKAGRYTMTGTGPVNIYGTDGKLERTVVLKPKGDTSQGGVTEYVINLENGEKLGVENTATLEPFSASSASTSPRPTPSASPRATATPKPSATPKATATPAAASSSSQSKSNPKTGDSTPIGALSAIGAAALMGAVFIALGKKKR